MASSSFEFGKAKLCSDRLGARWHRVPSSLAKPNSGWTNWELDGIEFFRVWQLAKAKVL